MRRDGTLLAAAVALLLVTRGGVWAGCVLTPVCQGMHEATMSTGVDARGNCCKGGTVTGTQPNANVDRCLGDPPPTYSYWTYTRTLTNMNHSGQCTDTDEGPCLACGVPQGQTDNCMPLIGQVVKNFHKLEGDPGLAYEHYWEGSITTWDCNCGKHTCGGSP